MVSNFLRSTAHKSYKIVPAKSVGNFLIGRPLSDFANHPELCQKKSGAAGYEFHHAGSTIKCFVGARTGLCYRITVECPTEASTEYHLKCGMSFSAALRADPSLYLDEIYEALYSRSFEGIGCLLNVDDPLPRELLDLYIRGIEVFDPHLVSVEEVIERRTLFSLRRCRVWTWVGNLLSLRKSIYRS